MSGMASASRRRTRRRYLTRARRRRPAAKPAVFTMPSCARSGDLIVAFVNGKQVWKKVVP